METTLAILKPDLVRSGKTEEVLQVIHLSGFTILQQQRLQERPVRACQQPHVVVHMYSEAVAF